MSKDYDERLPANERVVHLRGDDAPHGEAFGSCVGAVGRFLRVAQLVELPGPHLGNHSNGDSTRLNDKPLSVSHMLPECTTCARNTSVPGHSSSDASRTLVFTTRGLSWTNSEISSWCFRAASTSTLSSQLKSTHTVRPSSVRSSRSCSSSSTRPLVGSFRGRMSRRPSSSRRATFSSLRSSSARSSSKEGLPGPSLWYLTRDPPLASPALKKAASRWLLRCVVWVTASRLSGTRRNAYSCPTSVFDRSRPSKNNSKAVRRTRQKPPILMAGKFPSWHQPTTVRTSTPKRSAASSRVSISSSSANGDMRGSPPSCGFLASNGSSSAKSDLIAAKPLFDWRHFTSLSSSE